mgnify:CR=1 FL=1
MLTLLLNAALAAPQWTIQVDPLTAALGFPHLQVERVLAESWSVYAGPHARLFDGLLSEEPEPFLGVGLEAGVRYYWAGRAPEGGWLLARGVGAYAWRTDTDASSPSGYGSLLAGYTGILGEWLVLSGGAGGQYIRYGVDDLGTKGFFPALHTAVGVAL